MSKRFILLSFLFIIVGVLIGRFLPTQSKASVDIQANQTVSVDEVRSGGYKFISPLLECDPSRDSYKIVGLDPLRIKMENFVQREKEKGNITEGSVYFRDLNNGPWFGVNEHSAFAPASLLKLPVMMAYFQKWDQEPDLLSKKVLYEGRDPLLSQEIPSQEMIRKGQTYTYFELIERMMKYSDNAALTVLENNIEPSLIDKVTLDLGVETANTSTPENFMSVRGYASLFRILYNASYLSKKSSEKALQIMSMSGFTKGIVAGVPSGVVVSHKFGEREIASNKVQLHDCGIVYHSTNPYLICIMTKGTNLDSLEKVIASVSRMVYKEIDAKSAY